MTKNVTERKGERSGRGKETDIVDVANLRGEGGEEPSGYRESRESNRG